MGVISKYRARRRKARDEMKHFAAEMRVTLAAAKAKHDQALLDEAAELAGIDADTKREALKLINADLRRRLEQAERAEAEIRRKNAGGFAATEREFQRYAKRTAAKGGVASVVSLGVVGLAAWGLLKLRGLA